MEYVACGYCVMQGRDCFICQQKGHRAKDCPKKNTSSRICLRCGELGLDMFSCINDYSSADLKEIQDCGSVLGYPINDYPPNSSHPYLPPPLQPMSSSIDWSSLPPELLQVIATYLPRLIDYTRFRAVCWSWCSAALKHCPFLPLGVPYLLDTTDDSSSIFLDPFTTYSFKGKDLSEFFDYHRFVGSSHGRVILADGLPDGVIVFNTLNGEKTHLPTLVSYPEVSFDSSRSESEYMIQFEEGTTLFPDLVFIRDFFIYKVILAHCCEDKDRPNKQPFAFLLSGMRIDIAYCRHGDRSWRFINGTGDYTMDAIYSKGTLYAVNYDCSLAICNLKNDPPVVNFITMERRPLLESHSFPYHLVEVMGELHMVKRYLSLKGKTLKCEVYKFDWSMKQWKEIKSLGNKVLFVGLNSSLAFEATDIPGGQENTICFTSHYQVGEDIQDVGVYHMNTQSVEELCLYHTDLLELIWVTPCLCETK